MKIWMIGGILGLAAMIWAGNSVSGQKVPAEKYGWLTDWQAARNLAKKTGKPLLVVFRCEP